MKPLPSTHELNAANAQLLAEILLEEERTLPPIGQRGSTAAGDRARLRGLPAVAPGVAGAIPGSDPLDALLAKERRNGRR